MIRAFLLLLSLVTLTACRTIQKASSSSNTSQMQAESSKYNREIVTEYIVRDTATGKPVIVNVMPSQPGSITPQSPLVITQKEPYIIRQTIRESGEQQAVKTEQAQVETKDKEASIPKTVQIALLVGAFSLFGLVILGFIFLIKK